MNFARIDLDGSQHAFVAEVRDVLDKHWTVDEHSLAQDHDRPTPELIEELARRGWIHPRAPREQGGAGLGAVEARILELLAVEYRVPRADNELILPTLRKYGSPELQATILPDLESGRASFCLGYTEPDGGSDMAAARTRAVRDGDDWLINGAKMYTTWADTSDYVFLLARTGALEERHRTLTMFFVPMDSAGVDVQPIWAMGGVRTNMTYYRDVRVPDRFRLGPVDGGWQVVSEPLAAEHGHSDSNGLGDLNSGMGAMFTETLERLLGLAVDWARDTTTDAGRPALEDPEIRRRLATMLLDVEVCRNAPAEFGKVIASETLMRHADALADLTAPDGVLSRGADGSVADGAMSWARLFAPATAVYGGTSDVYRNNLSRRALGLPRSR